MVTSTYFHAGKSTTDAQDHDFQPTPHPCASSSDLRIRISTDQYCWFLYHVPLTGSYSLLAFYGSARIRIAIQDQCQLSEVELEDLDSPGYGTQEQPSCAKPRNGSNKDQEPAEAASKIVLPLVKGKKYGVLRP